MTERSAQFIVIHIIQTLLIHQLGYLIRVFLVVFFSCVIVSLPIYPVADWHMRLFSRLYKSKSNVTEQRPQFLYTWNVFPIELHMYGFDIMFKIYIRLKFCVLFAQSEKKCFIYYLQIINNLRSAIIQSIRCVRQRICQRTPPTTTKMYLERNWKLN